MQVGRLWNAGEAGVVSSSCSSVARAADGLRWIGGQTRSVVGGIHCHTLPYIAIAIAIHLNTLPHIADGLRWIGGQTRSVAGHSWAKYISKHCHTLRYFEIHFHTLPLLGGIPLHCHALPLVGRIHFQTLPNIANRGRNTFHCIAIHCHSWAEYIALPCHTLPYIAINCHCHCHCHCHCDTLKYIATLPQP